MQKIKPPIDLYTLNKKKNRPFKLNFYFKEIKKKCCAMRNLKIKVIYTV